MKNCFPIAVVKYDYLLIKPQFPGQPDERIHMKIKLIKSAISILLCLCMLVSFSAVSFADSEKKTDYPFIYVHGMYGWGEDSAKEA